MKIRSLFTSFALLFTGAANAQVVVDTFNRPDGTDLGANWTEQAGDASIVNHAVQGTNLTLITLNDAVSNTVSADVFFNGTALQYAALVLGYAGVADNLFVKVQNNSGSAGYDTAFYYYGNNGSGFASTDALIPFTSARLSLTWIDAAITLLIDTNFDGVPEQSFTRTGFSTASLGTGVGLGFYGAASFDNFALVAVPEPGSIALLLVGLPALFSFQFVRRKRAA